ncbi:MAG: Zinc-finger domain [Pseudomonadota bacterium]|jgi:uncharacterized Zn-finger protein
MTVTNKKEKILIETKHVSCSGSEYPYDHPVIYLEIKEKEGKIECPYCSKIFVLNK